MTSSMESLTHLFCLGTSHLANEVRRHFYRVAAVTAKVDNESLYNAKATYDASEAVIMKALLSSRYEKIALLNSASWELNGEYPVKPNSFDLNKPNEEHISNLKKQEVELDNTHKSAAYIESLLLEKEHLLSLLISSSSKRNEWYEEMEVDYKTLSAERALSLEELATWQSLKEKAMNGDTSMEEIVYLIKLSDTKNEDDHFIQLVKNYEDRLDLITGIVESSKRDKTIEWSVSTENNH